MTFSETHDHDGHAVLCHDYGKDEPTFSIFEKENDLEEGTAEIATEDEAIAYCKKHDLKPLFIVTR